MLDAETLRTIRNIPTKERIALIVALITSLDPQQAQSIQPAFLSLINSVASQSNEHQASLDDWKVSIRQGMQQTAASEQPNRPAFGFMKGTGSIHGDIVSPAVPENDWEALQ